MTLAFTIFVGAIITIGFLTYNYEKKLERMQDHLFAVTSNKQKVIAYAEMAISDYNILVEIMEDHFTEEELQVLYKEKKDEIIFGKKEIE